MPEIVDLMTVKPIIIPSSHTISEALHVFIENGMTSAPVVDAHGEILGLLTELGLIRGYFRLHSKTGQKEHLAYHMDILEPCQTIQEDAHVQETVKLLLKTPTHRVVVLDKHKKITGIISPKDILRVFTGERDKKSRIQRDLQETRDNLRQLTGQLKDAEEIISRYHGYFENAPFMIHSVNEEGKIVLANRRLSEALGYKPSELVGKTIKDLFDEENYNKAMNGLKKLMLEGVHPAVVTVMKCKDGSTMRVEACSTTLRSEKGDFIATITMSRRLASDNMLRALHGVLDMDANPHQD